jgi:hypothetical protein
MVLSADSYPTYTDESSDSDTDLKMDPCYVDTISLHCASYQPSIE